MARILIIDCDIFASEVASVHFEMRGHTVLTASDGLAGIRALATFRPDALISEITLPMRSGYEVVAHARQDPVLTGLICAFLSSNSTAQEVTRAKAFGIDAILSKPFSPSELVNRIEDFLLFQNFARAA